jgi:hypothetical protein
MGLSRDKIVRQVLSCDYVDCNDSLQDCVDIDGKKFNMFIQLTPLWIAIFH